MKMSLKIRTILLERKISIKELSEKTGDKGSTLYHKLERNNLTENDLNKIAEALNCRYESAFYDLETGEKL